MTKQNTKKLRMTFHEWKAWLETEDAVKYYQKLSKEIKNNETK